MEGVQLVVQLVPSLLWGCGGSSEAASVDVLLVVQLSLLWHQLGAVPDVWLVVQHVPDYLKGSVKK